MSKKILALALALVMVCSLCLTPALAASDAPSKTFPDAESSWAESSINRWGAAGVVTGDTNGNFNPGKYLSRAELATVLVRLLGLSETAAADTFSDVPANAWYADAVLKNAAAGIMKGDGTGKAMPEQNVTREQAITMIGRALGAKGGTEADLAKFSDAAQVANWSESFAAAFTAMGILNGVEDGSRVAPQLPIDRASAMALLDKAIASYITEPGDYTVNAENKFVVVNVPNGGNVTVRGTAAGILATPGNAANLDLKGVDADTLKIDSPVEVNLDGKTNIDTVTIADGAAKDDKTPVVNNRGTINNLVANDNVTLTGKKPANTTVADGVTVGGSTSSGSTGGGGGGRPSTTASYDVTVATTGNAADKVSVGLKGRTATNGVYSVKKDAEVEVVVTVAEGADVTYTITLDAEGVEVKDNKFTMPGKDVTVTVDVTEKTPVVEPADKTALNAAIAAAKAAAEAATVSTDGKDVDPADKWVTAADKKDLTDAIAAAQAVADDPDATQDEVKAAEDALAAAVAAFEAAKKPGTKQPEPAKEPTYVLDISEEVAAGKLTEGALEGSTEKPAPQIPGLGTDGMFTLIVKQSGGATIDTRNSKTEFEDKYAGTYNYKTGGGVQAASLVGEGKCITFTTSAESTVKVWWCSGSGSGSNLALANQTGDAEPTQLFVTPEKSAQNMGVITVFEKVPAGVNYLYSPDGTARFFRVEIFCDEPTPTVDKTALTAAITAANEAKKDVTVNAGPAENVDRGVKFVTEAEMKALTDAIAAAQAVADNKDATQADVNKAAADVNKAVEDFTKAVKTGTKTEKPEPETYKVDFDVTAGYEDAVKATLKAGEGVTANGDGTYTVDKGTTVTVELEYDDEVYEVTADATTFEVTADKTVKVTVTMKEQPDEPKDETYKVDFDVTAGYEDVVKATLKAGEGVKDNGDGTYTVDKGTTVTVELEYDDEVYEVTADVTTFEVTADKTVKVTVKEIEKPVEDKVYTVTLDTNANVIAGIKGEGVTYEGNVYTVKADTVLTLVYSIANDTDLYTIAADVDGVAIADKGTFTATKNNMKVTVKAEKKPLVTVVAEDGAAVPVEADDIYKVSSDVYAIVADTEVTVNVPAGYTIDPDATTVTVTNGKFLMPGENVTITVKKEETDA